MTATEVEKANNNSSTVRRNRPGTKCSAFSRWPDENFEEMDSTLAVQQFVQQSIRKDVMDVDAILSGNFGISISLYINIFAFYPNYFHRLIKGQQ